MLRKSVTLALVSWFALSQSAMADSVTFTPDPADKQGNGTLVGQYPVTSIGTVALPQGRAEFNGRTITLEAVPEWLFDRDDVLDGVVIHAAMTNAGGNAIVKGLAYFNSGSWIKNLAPLLARDTIHTTSGGTVSGNVQAVLADGLEILQYNGGRRKVAFNEIESIDSPRAFNFAASAEQMKIDPASSASGVQGQALQVAFAPVAMNGRVAAHSKAVVPKSNLPGTEGGISNSVIASQILIDVAVNVVAPAVAIPLVFGKTRNAQLKDRLREDQAIGGTFGPINP